MEWIRGFWHIWGPWGSDTVALHGWNPSSTTSRLYPLTHKWNWKNKDPDWWTWWIDLKLIKLLTVSHTGLFLRLLLRHTDRCHLMYTKTQPSLQNKCKQCSCLQTTTLLCGAALPFFRFNVAVLIICLNVHIKFTWLGSRSLPGWKLSQHLVKISCFVAAYTSWKHLISSVFTLTNVETLFRSVAFSLSCHTTTVLLTVWHHSQLMLYECDLTLIV